MTGEVGGGCRRLQADFMFNHCFRQQISFRPASLQKKIRWFTPGKVILLGSKLDSTLFCRWHWGLVHRLVGGSQQTWQREQEQFWPNRVLLISQLMNLYLLAPNWPWAMPVKAPLWADLWPLGTVKRKESGQC